MNLKIKAVLQIVAMTTMAVSVGLTFAFYNRLVGDQYTLYTVAGLCMAGLFYSMYRLLVSRLEYEEHVKNLSEDLKKSNK
jgi:RsiW-degrading membrane proteinase PrsW (M82 family)